MNDRLKLMSWLCETQHIGTRWELAQTEEGFICTSPSWLSVTSSSSQCCWTRMTSQTIECYQFWCHFAESQKMACYLKQETYLVLSVLRFSEMTSELITFNHLRCHSRSTALGARTGYWKPTRRGTDETPQTIATLIFPIVFSWNFHGNSWCVSICPDGATC